MIKGKSHFNNCSPFEMGFFLNVILHQTLEMTYALLYTGNVNRCYYGW